MVKRPIAVGTVPARLLLDRLSKLTLEAMLPRDDGMTPTSELPARFKTVIMWRLPMREGRLPEMLLDCSCRDVSAVQKHSCAGSDEVSMLEDKSSVDNCERAPMAEASEPFSDIDASWSPETRSLVGSQEMPVQLLVTSPPEQTGVVKSQEAKFVAKFAVPATLQAV